MEKRGSQKCGLNLNLLREVRFSPRKAKKMKEAVRSADHQADAKQQNKY
jgi:hypothetical protein